jgi:Tol biopolymer transport system component
VRRCLAKDPEDRWDTAHDVADELRWIGETAPAPTAQEGPRRGRGQRSAWAVAGLLATVLLGVGGVWILRPTAAPPPIVRSQLDVRPAEQVRSGGPAELDPTPGGALAALAWTPDGRALVFVGWREGVRQLYVRDLGAREARPLPGTEGALAPVVSPDGEWVAFWARGALRKVRLTGGPAAVVADDTAGPPLGLSWGRNGELFLGHREGSIWRASTDDASEPVTARRDTEVSHSLPHLLPGGDVLLFTVRKRKRTWGGEVIVAQVLATGQRKALLHDATEARYVPSGHLVFLRRGTLFAVAFDRARLEILGEPVPLLDGVSQALVAGSSYLITGAGQFAVAPNGSLAYVKGEVPSYPETQPVTVDRQGRASVLATPPRPYIPVVRVSPDGRRLVLGVTGLEEWSLWVFDIARGTLARVTTGLEADWPGWSTDGERVVFPLLSGGVWQLAWQRTGGAEPPEILARDVASPPSWTPDGRRFAFVNATRAGDLDIWVGTLEGSRATLRPLLETPHAERWTEVSPDGRWLAYVSDDSGRDEVYVQPFPGPGPRTQVSVKGGISPAWNPSGGELFFVTPPDPDEPDSRHMMVVEVSTHPALRLGTPRALFRFSATEQSFTGAPSRCYDVSADGQHFYIVRGRGFDLSSPVTHIQLVQNWLEEVKARVPTRR